MMKAGEFYTLTLAGIPIEAVYRNVKSMRLTVYPPDGRVLIAAPAGTSLILIKNFAVNKLTWIKKHRDRFLQKTSAARPAPGGTLKNHSKVFLWGDAYELELIERRGNPKIIIEDGLMKMYVRPLSTKAKKLEFMDKWYRRIIKEAAEPLIKKWETILNMEINKLYIRKMKSHWGSCNYQRQTLRLNSELAKRNPVFLEYVIVHEMLHIIESGHNKDFYRLLSKFIPDWKMIRKKLNSGEP